MIDLGDGLQILHAITRRTSTGAAPRLDIRPLLWKDGWPLAGDNVKEGTYQMTRSARATRLSSPSKACQWAAGSLADRAPAAVAPAAPAGTTRLALPELELLVLKPPVGGGIFAGTGAPIADQQATNVLKNWPTGNIDVRMSNYMAQAQQKWAVTPVDNAEAIEARPTSNTSIAGTIRALSSH